MYRAIAPLALSLTLASHALAEEPLDCQAFMTGYWAGAGEVQPFGQTVEVDNKLWLNADGTFKSQNRFKPADQEWQVQETEGKWTAEAGQEGDAVCLVAMSMEGTLDGGGTYSSSSSSVYVIVDDDTVTSMDFPMKREVPPQS